MELCHHQVFFFPALLSCIFFYLLSFLPTSVKTNLILVESYHTLLLHSNPVSPCLEKTAVAHLHCRGKCEFHSHKQVIISELNLPLFIQCAQCVNEIYLQSLKPHLTVF